MADSDNGDGQGQRGDVEGRELLITMLPGGAGWRIYYGDLVGGRYVNISDYQEIADYVLSRRPRSELLTIYPQLRGL